MTTTRIQWRLIQLPLALGHPEIELNVLGRRIHLGCTFGVRIRRLAIIAVQKYTWGMSSPEFTLRGASAADGGVQFVCDGALSSEVRPRGISRFDFGVVSAPDSARVGMGTMAPSTGAEPGGNLKERARRCEFKGPGSPVLDFGKGASP